MTQMAQIRIEDARIAQQLQEAMAGRKKAEADYALAIRMAKRAGWTNTDIGLTCGLTEAAIRRWVKRNGA